MTYKCLSNAIQTQYICRTKAVQIPYKCHTNMADYQLILHSFLGLNQNNLNSEVKVEEKDWSIVAEATAAAEAAAATQHSRGYPDLLDCHQNNYLMMMEMTTAQQHQQQPPPPPFQPQIHSWRPVQMMTSSRPPQYGSVTLANYG